MKNFTRNALTLALASVMATPVLAQENTAKNVILMITDGTGIETFRAASYFRHGALGHEVYDEFDTQLFMATHPLNTSTTPTKSDDGTVTFEPAELWNDEAVDTVYEGSLVTTRATLPVTTTLGLITPTARQRQRRWLQAISPITAPSTGPTMMSRLSILANTLLIAAALWVLSHRCRSPTRRLPVSWPIT